MMVLVAMLAVIIALAMRIWFILEQKVGQMNEASRSLRAYTRELESKLVRERIRRRADESGVDNR